MYRYIAVSLSGLAIGGSLLARLPRWLPLLVSLSLITEYGHNRFSVTGLIVARDLLSLKGNEDTFTRSMLISVPLYFSFSFFTNLLVTFLIGFRLWTVSRAVASLRTGGRSLRTVAILIVCGGTMVAFSKLTMNIQIGICCSLSNRQSLRVDSVRNQR